METIKACTSRTIETETFEDVRIDLVQHFIAERWFGYVVSKMELKEGKWVETNWKDLEGDKKEALNCYYAWCDNYRD
jgi:hypothetical protein